MTNFDKLMTKFEVEKKHLVIFHFNFVNNTFLLFMFISIHSTMLPKATISTLKHIKYLFVPTIRTQSPYYLNVYPFLPKQTLNI